MCSWKKSIDCCRSVYDSVRIYREQMSIAAYEAGVSFSNASVTLVHGMSRPIDAIFHVPHAVRQLDEIYLKNGFEDFYYARVRAHAKFMENCCNVERRRRYWKQVFWKKFFIFVSTFCRINMVRSIIAFLNGNT